MKKIAFTKEERSEITQRIQLYFAEELEHEIGKIPSELLLEFFSEEVGKYFYNRGLFDAQASLMGKIDDFADAIYALEQPTQFRR